VLWTHSLANTTAERKKITVPSEMHTKSLKYTFKQGIIKKSSHLYVLDKAVCISHKGELYITFKKLGVLC
jgi:hypothetical protein